MTDIKSGATEVDRRKTGILLVDDDETLVDISSRILHRLGYRVIGARSGEEALEKFHAHSDEIDLVITDTTMPGMSGFDLSATLAGIRPDMPIIVCSGYNSEISQEKAKSLGIRAYLNKPFVTEDMQETIRRVLNGRTL